MKRGFWSTVVIRYRSVHIHFTEFVGLEDAMRIRWCFVILLLSAAACSERTEVQVAVPGCDEKLEWSCRLDDFQRLPIEKKVKAASAIVVTKNRREGGSVVEYVDEVIALQPGTKLYLRPGVKYKEHTDSADYGDGSVAILRGSPATVVESYSYNDGSILGLGHMPMSSFRELAQAR